MLMKRLMLVLCVLTGMVGWGPAEEETSIPYDPTGRYRTPLGDLSLMLAGDVLMFSYTAVFGEAAHLCDGIGLAGLDSHALFLYVHDEGTVAFRFHPDGVAMEVIDGVSPFCGAYWPGDRAARGRGESPLQVAVTAERAYFHTATQDPERRRGYCVRGDLVEVLPVFHGTGEGFVMARFRSPRATTMGLIRRADLARDVVLPGDRPAGGTP